MDTKRFQENQVEHFRSIFLKMQGVQLKSLKN